MTQDDPHGELHQQAATKQQHDDPVRDDGGDWKTELAKVNKELTKRINDVRTDNDKFKSSTSKSVQALSDEVTSAKTSIQNNKDSIAAQDALIEQAKQKAEAAKQAADDAASKAAKAQSDVQALRGEYDKHTHDVTITTHGKTDPPTKGGK